MREERVALLTLTCRYEDQALLFLNAELLADLGARTRRKLALNVTTVMDLFPQAPRKLIFLANVEDTLVPKDENAVVEPSQDVVITAARPSVHGDSGRVENVTQH